MLFTIVNEFLDDERGRRRRIGAFRSKQTAKILLADDLLVLPFLFGVVSYDPEDTPNGHQAWRPTGVARNGPKRGTKFAHSRPATAAGARRAALQSAVLHAGGHASLVFFFQHSDHDQVRCAASPSSSLLPPRGAPSPWSSTVTITQSSERRSAPFTYMMSQ